MYGLVVGVIAGSIWFFIWGGWLLYVEDFSNDDREHGLLYKNAGCFVGYVVAMLIMFIFLG